jgi:hypothetical protein
VFVLSSFEVNFESGVEDIELANAVSEAKTLTMREERIILLIAAYIIAVVIKYLG